MNGHARLGGSRPRAGLPAAGEDQPGYSAIKSHTRNKVRFA